MNAYTASAYATSATPIDPAAASNPYVQPPPIPLAMGQQTSPGLAFILGLIPGVGAIYNGQYIKGLVHAVIFGLLISLANSAGGTAGLPLIIMTMVSFIFYMPFEAFHTAKKRQLGLPVDEFSSLIGRSVYASRVPIGAIVLILVGVLFLLDSLRVIEFRDIERFWPLLLIAAGAYMLYVRVTGPGRSLPAAGTVPPLVDDVMGARNEQ